MDSETLEGSTMAVKSEFCDQQKRLFEKWVSPNEFSCKICNQYTQKRRDTFTTHVSRKHKTGIKEYEAKYEKIKETRIPAISPSKRMYSAVVAQA